MESLLSLSRSHAVFLVNDMMLFAMRTTCFVLMCEIHIDPMCLYVLRSSERISAAAAIAVVAAVAVTATLLSIGIRCATGFLIRCTILLFFILTQSERELNRIYM